MKKGDFELSKALTKPDKAPELSSLLMTKKLQNVLASKLSEISDVPQTMRLAILGPGSMSGEEDI